MNVVEDECRILASRERCPFLIHLEVAETGLRGSDSRLYASGAPNIGTTIEEALALSAQAASAAAASSDPNQQSSGYKIPGELLADTPRYERKEQISSQSDAEMQCLAPEAHQEMPRGGWQADEAFYSHNPEDVFVSNPYDAVRENEYQQLHEQMHSEYGMMEQPQMQQDQQ